MMLIAMTLALAAAPVSERRFVCVAVDAGQVEKRFSFAFTPDKDKAKNVTVTETDRVFTPGNAVATFRTGPRGSFINEIPRQRPGKWTGTIAGGTLDFALKARDGAASFSLAPDPAKPGAFTLSWRATLNPPFGGEETAQGTGSCTEQAGAIL
ncbi:MAG: hypothetical protein V4574_12635 [Pseudomonadota bacterium]